MNTEHNILLSLKSHWTVKLGFVIFRFSTPAFKFPQPYHKTIIVTKGKLSVFFSIFLLKKAVKITCTILQNRTIRHFMHHSLDLSSLEHYLLCFASTPSSLAKTDTPQKTEQVKNCTVPPRKMEP